MNEVPDDELMRLFQEGEVEAFDMLFERYRGPVYNFAWAMLRNPASAEDVLQDTFLSVARTAQQYEPRGCFRAWLMRITRNRCLNLASAENLRRPIRQSDALLQIRSDTVDPPDGVIVREQMERIDDAIAKLPEHQREAIVLYAFEDMSYREISDVLDMPINTVKTLIHRARATLAEALDEEGEER